MKQFSVLDRKIHVVIVCVYVGVWISSLIFENHCSWVSCLYANINEAMIQLLF